jgi:50S ribosome-binding GTPase
VNSTESPPGRREAIAAIVGSTKLKELDAAWESFSTRHHMRVTVYGPYDSGKTTLIKRLLIESGTTVPDWLTISGRPETAKVTEAESEGIVYADTPGTSGPSAEHNQLAEQALRLTDAVLAVLPQQRLREDTGRLAELAARCPHDALYIVIAQSDTVGADPQSDLTEFQRLCEHRRAELLKMLPGELARALAGAVHVVAADPYGEVGNARQPDPSHYDSYREWDGIAKLRASLSSLAQHLPELREAAQGRYWEWAAALAHAESDQELAQLAVVLAEAEQRGRRQALLDRELIMIDEAAASDLQMAIYDELQAVTRAADGMDVESIRSATEERLQHRVHAWQVEYGGKLGALAREADLELALQAVNPGSVAYDQWLHQLITPQPQGQGQEQEQEQEQEPASSSVAERMGEFSASATTAVKGVIRLRLGVPVDEARRQLKTVSDLRAKAGAKFAEQVASLNPDAADYQAQRKALVEEAKKPVDAFFTGDSLFASLAEAEQCRKWISRMDIVGEFVPAALSLGGLMAEQISSRWTDKAERQKRHDERVRVRNAAEAFTAEILGNSNKPIEGSWREAVSAIRARLHADPLLEPVTVAAKERIGILESARSALR